MQKTSAFACLIVLLALGGTAAQQEGVFEYPSASTAKVLIIGKSANLKIFPNKTSSAYLSLKFNRLEELDENGKTVLGHAITSLASLTPAYVTGTRTSGDTDYTYVKMVYDAATLKLPACPSGDEDADLALSSMAKGPGAFKGAAKAAPKPRAAAPQPQQFVAEAQPIKTLGDTRLAATIAALTAVTVDPPPRPEAMIGSRKRSLLGSAAASRDPFAGLVSAPKAGAGGVSVITHESSEERHVAAAPVPAGGAPTLALTFYFGMSANKTFAYGKGINVVVPADGVKFNIEASNWPFCSPLNTLKFDIAVATNLGVNAQAQLMLDPTTEVSNPSAMITDMYATSARRRNLLQPADITGGFLDMETAAALASAGKPKQPKLPIKTAKLLISNYQAAVVELATVAYPSVGSAINSTVDVGLMSTAVLAGDATSGAVKNATLEAVSSANALGGSRLTLTFPYFETLYYDPVIYFTGTDGMNVNIETTAPKGNCTGVVCGRTAERRVNGADALSLGIVKQVLTVVVGAAFLLALW